MRSAKPNPTGDSRPANDVASPLRIIGGTHRGRKLLYSGDPRTRPMKDRVREAVFNLLGPEVRGKHAVDLFAGTGALGLEALSRGADRATFYEQHFPTADVLRQNAATLGSAHLCQVIAANTFLQFRRGGPPSAAETPERPWLIFCSPPYEFYVSRQAEMLDLLAKLRQIAPPGSIQVVEADNRFDFNLLPDANQWDVRDYHPAFVAVGRF